jgi:predicted AAA+ superfamily ATPase
MRGVGKSTWAKQRLPDAPRFDLLDEGLYQSYLRDPSLFGRELARVPEGHWVVVDEVQRLPSLLNDVHRFIEDRRLRFALLGSSARTRAALRGLGGDPAAGLWRPHYRPGPSV